MSTKNRDVTHPKKLIEIRRPYRRESRYASVERLTNLDRGDCKDAADIFKEQNQFILHCEALPELRYEHLMGNFTLPTHATNRQPKTDAVGRPMISNEWQGYAAHFLISIKFLSDPSIAMCSSLRKLSAQWVQK